MKIFIVITLEIKKVTSSVRTNCRKVTASYAGPILWNSFPQQLRQLPSEALFKKKTKIYFTCNVLNYAL